jgi:DNA uptake protein ComE-like DNA-binding protein
MVGVNGKDLATLYDQLAAAVGEDIAKFVLLYRQYGASTTKTSAAFLLMDALAAGDGATVQIWDATGNVQGSGVSVLWLSSDGVLLAQGKKGGGSSSQTKTVEGSLADLSRDTLVKGKASKKVGSLFDLINAKVTVPGKDKEPSVVYTSPLTDGGGQQVDLLVKLFNAATAFDGTEIPARININTAPREVLLTIPGVKEADVDSILANRHVWSADTAPEEIDLTLAWLLTKGKLKVDTLKQLEKYVTARTQVYRVQAIGYFDGQGPSARVEAVIDTNAGRPRILYWRDLSELGRGFEMQEKQ